MSEKNNERLAGLSEQERKALLAHLLHKKNAKLKTAPLSFAQQRLWFMDQLEPDSAAYNISKCMSLRGALDITMLGRALQQVAQRHEALRTTFQVIDGEPQQAIAPETSIRLVLTDLSIYQPEKQKSEIENLAQAEAQRPFDLTSGPLVRVNLLRLADDDHILLLTMHHIISDGWSIGVFFHEMILLSQAYANGQENPLPVLPIQYADFAVWQRGWLQGEVLDKQMDYWKEQLANMPESLAISTNHSHHLVQTYHGANLPIILSHKLVNNLRTIGHQEDATLFMTLLAAFQMLLSRYSGQTDIVVGSPIANRNRKELEGMIGFFVNTLVLRTDLSDDPSFRQLLQRVRKVTLGAYAHQDVPFEKLVSEVQTSRDMRRSPLFQVMFVLQNTPMDAMELPGLSINTLVVDTKTAKFDLTLLLTETEQGLLGRLEYNTDLFELSTIERLARHFQALLDGIVADPEQPLSNLPLLTLVERQQILVEWNATETEYPHEQYIHELFEIQAERTPAAVAVVFEDQQLTYAELNAKANQLAHYLHSQGVGPDVLVGICIDRSLEMVIGLMGILKAGGAYVPLDPTFPKERLAFMLADSRLPILLTQERLVADLPAHQARIICLDTDWQAISHEKAANLNLGGNPDQLAYVIYTSGSTGRPKGVQVIQRAVVNFLISMRQSPGIRAEDRLLSVTTLSFDIAGLELYLPLIVGAQVEVLAREIAMDGFRLRERLKTSGTTIMQATPATWRILLDADWKEEERVKILSGGEALTQGLANALLARSSSLWNLYGPTETTVWSTLACIEDADNIITPIGKPIANTQTYILDIYLNPVPAGMTGELYIAGDGLARGYLNQPDLTAEKFVPNPFGSLPGARMYKSGDLARYRSDGTIDYLGRIDFQVKIRGFRIELGEIEAALAALPEVHDVVVHLREDISGSKRLVAYLVMQPEYKLPETAILRRKLLQSLPEYMLPAHFIQLERLPLTRNGKIDRKALPAPDNLHSETGYVAPRNPVEKTLAGIWAKLLGLEQVGIHDNFFELGGDSLLGMRMVALANQETLSITPRQIFEHQTLIELAAMVNTVSGTQAEQGLVTGPVPLTCDQHWYLYYAAPYRIHPERWNSTVFLQVPSILCSQENIGVLEKVVRAIWEQHDALRARFVYQEPIWQQYLMEPDQITPFSHIDLSELSDIEITPALQAQADQIQGSLNFMNGPLFRVVVFDLGRHRPGRLLLIAHHLVIDGFSLGVLMNDMQECYLQLRQGRSIQLLPKTVSIRQWTERLHQYAQSTAVYEELDYWLNLPWADALPLPVDDPDGYQYDTVPAEHSISITFTSEETTLLLRDISTFYQTSPLHILLTVLTKTITHWTGGQAVEITCPILGRDVIPQGNNIDLSRTIGFLVLSKVLVLRRAETDDLLESLRFVETQLRQAPNQSCGYHFLSDLRGDAEITRQLKPLRKDQLLFNYVSQMKSTGMDTSWSPATEYPGNAQDPRQRPYHLLTIVGSTFENNLSLKWTYSPHLYQSTTIASLAQFFKETLLDFVKQYQDDIGNK